MMKFFIVRITVFVLLLINLTSCKVFQVQPLEVEDLIIFPPPPDTVRLQYLTSINNAEDIKGRRSLFMDFILGKDIPLGIQSPLEITSNSSELIICDNKIRGIEIIDLEEKTFEYFIPDARGKLGNPVSCTIDSRGTLFVADKLRKQIVVFNRTEKGFKYSTVIGDKDNYEPYDVLIHRDKLWVPNTKTRKIHVYNAYNYKPLFSFPQEEDVDSSIVVLPKYIEGFKDEIFVADFVKNNIKVFDLEGKYLRTIGSIGTFPGQFARIKDIDIARDKKLYAVDAAFGNVQIFNSKGQVLMHFGGQNGNSSDMFLPRAIHISYEHNKYFEEYLDPDYELKYIVYVSNQHGSNKVNVYGFVEEKLPVLIE